MVQIRSAKEHVLEMTEVGETIERFEKNIWMDDILG